MGGAPHDLRGALAVYGGSVAYADEILSLAEPPAQVAGLPVVYFLGFNPKLEPQWQTFDLRSVAWPDPTVVGFIDAPRLG